MEVRRRALEKFLVRVSHHPDLVTSKHLGIFLQARLVFVCSFQLFIQTLLHFIPF